MSEVVSLHGIWDSPFSCRVVWALKLKGISYNYIEEDMKTQKSELLLLYNPVHKKVPVLVHDGHPICESMIIIQYIDDTWPGKPLLPTDPYERALARFWVKYADEKAPVVWEVFMMVGEEQEKAKEECQKMLKTVEEEALGDDKKFFGGDEIGIVDIAFGWMAHWLGVIEEVLKAKLLQPHQFPRLHAWIHNFKQIPLIKQNLPNRDHMIAHFQALRQKLS